MTRLIPIMLGVFIMVLPSRAADPIPFPSQAGLPDPLTMLDGRKITTTEDWHKKRRPELKDLFQDFMYGRYPAISAKVTGKVVHEDKQAFGGKATLREVAVSIGVEKAPLVYWLIVTPNKRTAPAPVFIGLNFSGNHTLTADPKVHLPEGWMYDRYPGVKNNKATDEGRGKNQDVWPLEMIIDRGYAVATAYSGDIIPDNHKIRGGFADVLMPPVPGAVPPNQTATIMCWAWGVHRGIDYLVTMPEIDPKRIACVGHSRLGKTAIVATAFDDRIALGIPHQAGCGGTSPDRMKNPKGETVKRITTSFPHWFAPAFSTFAEDTTRLPFDQNGLVAICAPRPILFTNAQEDQWADPPGQFEILKAATPVYKLLGVEGVAENATVVEGKLIDSRLGYWLRAGKHSMTPEDWKIYMTFADKWMK